MSSKTRRKSNTKPSRINIPLTLEAPLAAKVDETSVSLGLTKQATMRLALERGLDVVLAQLTSKIPA